MGFETVAKEFSSPERMAAAYLRLKFGNEKLNSQLIRLSCYWTKG